MAGTYRADHYTIWASGADGPKGARLGCELWCHNVLPLATSSDFDVVVCHGDARRLIIKFNAPAFSFGVAVFHAPCLCRTKGNGHRPLRC